MGKTKNRRGRNKSNPTGLPSVKSIELEDDERGSSSGHTPSKHENIILTILDQLETYGIDSKLCGLNTLASMTEDVSFVESMLEHNVVKIVGPLLVDPLPPIRDAAAVALRNISGMGLMEICDILVDEDVLTYVFALFEKFYSSNWLPCNGNGEVSPMEQGDAKKTKKKSKVVKKNSSGALEEELVVNTFTQAVHILWNLCKSSELAVKIFNQQNILPCLSRCLDPKESGIDAAIAVAHCLQALTENNEVAAHELRQTSEEVLIRIISSASEGEVANSQQPSKYLLLQVLAAGIMLNIPKSSPAISPALSMRLLVPIRDAMAADHMKGISLIHDQLLQENGREHTLISQDDEESSEPMDSDDSPAVLIEDVVSLIIAKTVAVELVTNMHYGEDEEDDWVDCDDLMDVTNGDAISCGVPEVEQVFCINDNVDNILRMVDRDDVIWKRLETQPETKFLMSRINILRSRSLLCLQNVLSNMPDKDLKGFPGALSIWEKMANLVSNEGTSDVDLLEAATGAMRAISERMRKMDCKGFAANIAMPELEMLLNVEAKCNDSKTRVNIIRAVGTMGEALVQLSTEESCMLIQHVGNFLLQKCTKTEEELWVVAEALDALIDVFAEDSTDIAASQIGLVNSLKSLLPSLRSKLRQQRKSLGHHAAIVATANTNLERFIEYKVTHISSSDY